MVSFWRRRSAEDQRDSVGRGGRPRLPRAPRHDEGSVDRGGAPASGRRVDPDRGRQRIRRPRGHHAGLAALPQPRGCDQEAPRRRDRDADPDPVRHRLERLPPEGREELRHLPGDPLGRGGRVDARRRRARPARRRRRSVGGLLRGAARRAEVASRSRWRSPGSRLATSRRAAPLAWIRWTRSARTRIERMRRRGVPRVVAFTCAALASVGTCCRARGPAPRPNVLLVTIDTLRADRVGAGIAPTLDALAASGLWFAAARTAAPLTLPSHATIHTGLLPPEHGIRENGAGALAPEHATIARLLKEAGYQTAAFVGAFVLDRRFGLAQGFDAYDDQIRRDPSATDRLEAERPAGAVAERALAWLANRQSAINPQSATRNPPFFAWVHFYDPHAPYTPPPEYAARAKTPYDGEVAYADAQLGVLLDAVRRRGALDRTLVVVAGDHGEGLGDHGERTHGMLLYESTLRVPLIVVAPGRPAGRRDDPVSLTDLAPTILRAAGVTPPDVMKGRDLLEQVRLKPDTTDAARLKPDTTENIGRDSGSVRLQADLYAETEYPRVAGWSPLQALTDGRWMAIRAGASTEVYDLQNDPREEHDAAAAPPAIAAAMASRAEALHASATTSQAHSLSADAAERLRALGYVAGTLQPPPASGARNPATMIATWNDFEAALSALTAHVPDAVGALRRLASANPDAPVLQATYARAM